MFSPTSELRTIRDFLTCQLPELEADTVEYVFSDDQTKQAQHAAGRSCGPPCESGHLPTIQGTAVYASFESQKQQARDDGDFEEYDDNMMHGKMSVYTKESSEIGLNQMSPKHNEARKERGRQTEQHYKPEPPDSHRSTSVTEEDESQAVSRRSRSSKKKNKKSTKKEKESKKKHPPKPITQPVLSVESATDAMADEESKQESKQLLIKDKDDLSLVKKMINKYDRASAAAAPNIELHKVFENEEFITFRKVAVRPNQDRDFGGYDETEVLIEQSSTTSGCITDGNGSPITRVPRQVMIVISKKKL